MGLGPSTFGDIRLNTTLDAVQRGRFQNPHVIQSILRTAKTVAIVGLSTEKTKASNMVAAYLQDEGYRIIPIHPKAEMILGEPVYPSLAAIPFEVDVVDIFRPAHEVAGIVEEAIQSRARAVWMQLRLVDLDAAELALSKGVQVVADKCIKMEHGRYAGRLHWAGMNTEIISARKSKRA